ncbi:MAG: AraC family transcriptional regulator [Ruminococcaceae bacterium]|nr:AraC family transcriptional regulator [Oscillospiraceae bacterium]
MPCRRFHRRRGVLFPFQIKIHRLLPVDFYLKSNFCRNFKLATGTSFHNYLAKYRIINSCYLLRSTDYSIGKIAESVGCNDTHSFCRTFKKIMNMTPLQYRKAPSNGI